MYRVADHESTLLLRLLLLIIIVLIVIIPSFRGSFSRSVGYIGEISPADVRCRRNVVETCLFSNTCGLPRLPQVSRFGFGCLWDFAAGKGRRMFETILASSKDQPFRLVWKVFYKSKEVVLDEDGTTMILFYFGI